MKKVAVLMGSDSDWPVVRSACAQLDAFGIPYEAHIMSAHRSPAQVAEFSKYARKSGIGIPMKGGALDGLDALLATVQMPSGIPVATVALNGAKNAAILAAQILAVGDSNLASWLDAARGDMTAQIEEKDAALQKEI